MKLLVCWIGLHRWDGHHWCAKQGWCHRCQRCHKQVHVAAPGLVRPETLLASTGKTRL